MTQPAIDTPDIQLYMPEPDRLLEAVSGLTKVETWINSFIDLAQRSDVDEIIREMDGYITSISAELSEKPEVISCYKNEQQRRSDEYFFIARTFSDVEKRFILNTFVIARDVLINNKTDHLLTDEKVKTTLSAMAKFLSYTLLRG